MSVGVTPLAGTTRAPEALYETMTLGTQEDTVGSDDLLCAHCGGRVGDARCPTCRAARRQLQESDPGLPAGAVLLAALVVLLLLLALA